MLKLLKNLRKKDYGIICIVIALVTLSVWLELKMPDYMSEITKLVQTDDVEISKILIQGGYMLLCAFGSLISTIIVGYFGSKIATSLSMNIRDKIFKKVESLGMHEIKSFSTSSLITRTTNDVTHVEMLVGMGLSLIIRAPITAVWAITKILNKSWQWSAITALAVLVLLTTIAILVVIVLPRFKIVQKLTDKLNLVTRENLTGIRVVRAFNAEKYQKDKFEDVNNSLTNTQLFNQKTLSVLEPVMYLVMYSLTLAVYYIGARLIASAGMTDKIVLFGDMIVFSSYAMQVIISFLMLALIFMMVPRASVSAKRINEVLDTDASIKDGNITKNNNGMKGTVEFKDVSFKYPDADEYLLKNISFTANKGEIVAFIGSTGSGKSTLVNLVPRFYDVTDGKILVNGIDVKEYKQEYLHDIIGFVPQKAVMFNGTVESNVSYGKGALGKASLDMVSRAIKIAQAEEFVSNMEEGVRSHIAQGGTNVSGGQKQRLAIARAIARNPEIYVFDDSFSALDYKTDLNLRQALKEYVKEATCLIVAQRIGTIMNADKIVVLDEGKCVGIGTHEKLMKSCEVYKEIALSQLSKEELENA